VHPAKRPGSQNLIDHIPRVLASGVHLEARSSQSDSQP
jgi:hypothetical protein